MSSPIPTWRGLAQCCICCHPMFFPLYLPCNQHSACFKCVYSKLEHDKGLQYVIEKPTGIEHTYVYQCSNDVPGLSFVIESIEELQYPAYDMVTKIHSLRPAADRRCPWCSVFMGDNIEEGYNHLYKCTERPVLCKLCFGWFPRNLYTFHHYNGCTQFKCEFEGCEDGTRKGMTYSVWRAHNMSHIVHQSSLRDTLKELEESLRSIPHATEKQRRAFDNICTAAKDAFVDAISEF